MGVRRCAALPLPAGDFAFGVVVEPAAATVGFDNELNVGAGGQVVDADAGGLNVTENIEITLKSRTVRLFELAR